MRISQFFASLEQHLDPTSPHPENDLQVVTSVHNFAGLLRASTTIRASYGLIQSFTFLIILCYMV